MITATILAILLIIICFAITIAIAIVLVPFGIVAYLAIMVVCLPIMLISGIITRRAKNDQ